MKPFLLLVALASLGAAAQNVCAADSAIFDVRQSGAKGDGKTLDTAAIQHALDQCGKAGGGVVKFPPGVYLTKPLFLSSGVTLKLDSGALLQATDETSDFRRSDDGGGAATSASFLALINGRDLTNVTIAGPGIIDGAGARWWVPAEAAREKVPGYTLPRPKLILLNRCKNIRIHDLTLRNSPSYHIVPNDCQDLVISNVSILAPPHSPNTDAIDPGNCRDVLITHCRLDVGDDNVAIKGSRRSGGSEFACENILVSDCLFLHGHGFSIGSETAGGVNNVTLRTSRFEGTENGLRIKSKPGNGGIVQNITYSDLQMDRVDPAITFTTAYTGVSAKDPVQPPPPSAATVTNGRVAIYRDILIKNVTATCERSAGLIDAIAGGSISNVTFQNVHIFTQSTGLRIQNAQAIHFHDSDLTVPFGTILDAVHSQIDGIDPLAMHMPKP